MAKVTNKKYKEFKLKKSVVEHNRMAGYSC